MTANPAHGTTSVDAIVIGAGISGLVAASVLQRQGVRQIAVVDSYPQVGGNHLDSDAGGYTFDIGSLIFQDDSPLLAHFPELLPRYRPISPSWSRLNPQGRVATYPFSVKDDILAAGPLGTAAIIASLLAARPSRRPQHNALDYAEHWLGRRFVHSSGLGRYMHRLCGVPAQEIDLEFAQQRMRWIEENGKLTALSRRALRSLSRRPAAPATNTQLARSEEGYTHLYAPAVEKLEAGGARFVLDADLERLERHDGGFTLVTSRGAVTAPRVISTVPVDVALALTGQLRPDDDPLPTATLQSLYFSFSGQRGFSSSVLYNFSHGGNWKRLTVYSDFYGPRQGREYFGVEVVSHGDARPAEESAAVFRTHTEANGLLLGDLRLEGSHALEHAYPIYTSGSGPRSRRAIADLQAFGVESLGRQGGFQYQPTARHSTDQVEAVLGAGAPLHPRPHV